MIDTEIRHIIRPEDNIFSDLGFQSEEAKRLQEAGQLLIDTKIMLMNNVGQWINENKLKQAKAAEILGVSRPRVSDVVNHKINKFTLDSLLMMVSRTGKTVRIVFS